MQGSIRNRQGIILHTYDCNVESVLSGQLAHRFQLACQPQQELVFPTVGPSFYEFARLGVADSFLQILNVLEPCATLEFLLGGCTGSRDGGGGGRCRGYARGGGGENCAFVAAAAAIVVRDFAVPAGFGFWTRGLVANDLFNDIFNALRAGGPKSGYATRGAARLDAAATDAIVAIKVAFLVQALIGPNGGGSGGMLVLFGRRFHTNAAKPIGRGFQYPTNPALPGIRCWRCCRIVSV